MNYVIQVYRNYAAFDGRARRLEYWVFSGFVAAVAVLTLLLAQIGTDGGARGLRILGGAFLTLFILASIVPSFALRIRRLHDINRTGYWILIAFLPIIGSVLLLVFSLLPGTRGANRFGPDPKAVESELSEVFA
jgi:uncharacterized membrane protein YhaH (DUF805 family)